MNLCVEHLSLRAQEKTIVTDVSFVLPKNRTLAIIGPSGSGKTSLLKGILGITHDFSVSGLVRFHQDNEQNAPTNMQRFGYIPQELSLWPHLTVEATVELARHFSFGRHNQAYAKKLAADMLKHCGLENLKNKLPLLLSGGEKQRLALARALVSMPRVLVLDEPFSGLDIIAKSELIALITTLKKDVGFSILFVSHDLAETLALGDDIMIMDSGSSHWLGPKHELSTARFLPHWNPSGSPLVNLRHPQGVT